jgi:hypothetical protein
MEALKELKIELLYDLAIPLLGIYPKECKLGYKKDISTPMFIAALFTTVKVWKQVCTHMYAYIHMHIYMYVYIYIYIHNGI